MYLFKYTVYKYLFINILVIFRFPVSLVFI